MANLTGLTTNFFPTASETYANNLSSSISALAATVPVNSANEYTDGDVATITVDAGTSAEATFTGVKASTPARFINCIWTEGNLGVGHASGATVIDYDSATHMSQVSKGILKEHKQSGQHSNINADSIQVNGSIVATGDITEAGSTARTFRTEVLQDFVVTGGVWSQLSALNGQMTAVTAYITGYRNSIVAVASRAFTASKDTYVDILRTTVGATTTFTLVYTEVANGAAAPALAANSLRLAKVVTSGVAITSVLQNGADSLGNFIYPTKAVRPISYSSTETLTGNVWVDGRPVYRKVIRTNVTLVSGTANVVHGISGLTTSWEVVRITTGIKITGANNVGTQISTWHRESAGNWVMVTDLDTTNITVTGSFAWGSSWLTVVMEYVK